MTEDFPPPIRQSFLMWMFSALGWRYTFLLPLAASFAFVFVLLVVLRGKGPAMTGALLFLVPLPVLVGIVGFVDGLVASFQVISMSQTVPKPSQWAMGISMSLVSIWVGLLFSVPSYFVALIGLIVRSMIDEDPVRKSFGGQPRV